MASTFTGVWSQQQWSNKVLETLLAESALLNSPTSRVICDGQQVHLPRVAIHSGAQFVGELASLPSDAGVEDTVVLTPRKIGNAFPVSSESIEDAPVDVLDQLGSQMTRGLSHALDSIAFGAGAATSVQPAGLLYGSTPQAVAEVRTATGTSAITSIAITALEGALASGASVQINNGSGTTQNFTLSANASDGATTLAVASTAPSVSFGVGSTVVYGGVLAPDETPAGIEIDSILNAIGQIQGVGGDPNSIYISAGDLTTLRKQKASTGGQYMLAAGGQMGDVSQRPVETIGGAQLYLSPGIPRGTVLVADSSFIQVAIRRDIRVDFSPDAAFYQDGVVARITARLDWALADRQAIYLIQSSS